MALWHFTNLNKYGNPRSRIFHRPDGEAFSFNPNGFGSFVAVRRYKYEYEHPVMPPTILELNGKTYLMPLWKEVVKGTTINDIEWIKPKPKKKSETIVVETPSSKGDVIYKTRFYPDSGNYTCNCPGTWRAKDRMCKHIIKLKSEIENGKR
tara:strand:- start:1891 stop:2343 length:453 start_codon:yes stop_codon:yes gene_type:complete